MSEDLLKSKKSYFVSRKVSYIAYQTEDEVYRALVEALNFIAFLIVTTTLALHFHNINGFHSNDLYRRLFLVEELHERFVWEISTVRNIENWWIFMEKEYVDGLKTAIKMPIELSSEENDPIGLHNKPRILGVNILLQAPRLRQIRVKPKKCREPTFLEKNRTCYGRYSPSEQSHEPYHKGTKYMDTANSDIRPVWATIGYYSGGGYFQSLPPHKSKLIFKSLQDRQWIDNGTRLVELSFDTLNYNLGILNSIKFITEVLPTGSVVAAFYSTYVRLDSIWSVNDVDLLISAYVFYVLVIFNTAHEIYEMKTSGIRNYSKIIWNYFDWSIIIAAYISLYFAIAHPFYAEKFLNDIEKGDELASLDALVFNDVIYLAAISLCAFQLWIRLFRFITYNTTMLHYSMALRRCAPEIFGFALILIITFTIFAFLGLLIFGTKHPSFSTFTDAFFYMIRLMLHDFDYSVFNEADPFWGPIYIMCFIVIVVFILVNMFLAIISQTYSDVKQDKKKHPIAIKTVFLNFSYKIKNFFKNLGKKLRLSTKKRTSGTLSQKKIRFSKETNSSDTPTETDESYSKEISKNTALRDYFGIAPLASITSLVSSFDVYEDAEMPGETSGDTTQEYLSGLEERLELLEAGFKQLGRNIDHLLSKFEGKARKTLIMPRSD